MKTISRKNQDILYQSFYSPMVTAILGPRRIGKSTLVNKFSEREASKKWVKFNMDSLLERDRVIAQELADMISEQAGQRIGTFPKIWVLIDEAQKCPELFEQIKILYDTYKDQNIIKFILTGSAALELHQLAAESLSGRIELFHLQAFSLLETFTLQNNLEKVSAESIFDLIFNHKLDLLPQIIAELSPFKPKLIESLNEILIWGSLPEVLKNENTEERLRYLAQYLQTYLEKDIRAIKEIGNLKLYQQLLDMVAEQTGSLRNDAKILEILKCSRDTLNKYRGYLTATLMYCEVYPYIDSSLKRIVKSPKIYLQNNGLISFLTGIDEQQVLEKTGLIGHRLENWFLLELQIALERMVKRTKIFYWRTSSGVEVDFIIEKKPDLFPFEVTFSKNIQTKKVLNLQKFMKEYNVAHGFYIYNGDFYYDNEKRIFFLPLWCMG